MVNLRISSTKRPLGARESEREDIKKYNNNGYKNF